MVIRSKLTKKIKKTDPPPPFETPPDGVVFEIDSLFTGKDVLGMYRHSMKPTCSIMIFVKSCTLLGRTFSLVYVNHNSKRD